MYPAGTLFPTLSILFFPVHKFSYSVRGKPRPVFMYIKSFLKVINVSTLILSSCKLRVN